MSLRTRLCRFVRFVAGVCAIHRSGVIVLWRLHGRRGADECTCSFSEPSPGRFRVSVRRNGESVFGRFLDDIEELMRWTDELRSDLLTNGWHEPDGPCFRRAGVPKVRTETNPYVSDHTRSGTGSDASR